MSNTIPEKDRGFLVFQVGCIECGVSSYPVAITETLDEAKSIAADHPDTWVSEGGDGYVTIIDLSLCAEVKTTQR